MSTSNPLSSFVASPVTCYLLLVTCAAAATFTWDGGGADNNWQTAANWNPDGAPASDGSASLAFSGTTRTAANNNFTADTVFAGITLANDYSSGKTAAFTLSGNRIVLGGNLTGANLTVDGTITDTISLPILLNGTRTFAVNQPSTARARNLTVSGVIGETGGSRGLTKSGSGTLRLQGANTYSGKTTFSGGTLYFNTLKNVGGGASALGAPTTVENGIITVNSGLLRYNGNSTASDRIVHAAGGFTFYSDTSGQTLTLNGGFTGPGQLSFRGSGNFVINGLIATSNNVTRTDSGTVTFNNDANSFTGNVSISDGTFVTASIADGGLPCGIGAGTRITMGQGSFQTTGRLRFTGASGGSCNRALTINTYTGVHGGSIENTAAGQTLTLSGDISVSGGGSSIAPLTLTGAGNGVLAGTLESRLRIIKSGTGTWTLAGANGYTGVTSVANGTLLIASSTAPESAMDVAAGGTLGGTGTVYGTVAVAAGGRLAPGLDGIGTLTLVNAGADALTLNGAALALDIGDTAGVCDRLDLAGTLVLNGANVVSLSNLSEVAPAGVYTLLTYAAKSGDGSLALDHAYPNASLEVGDTAATLTVTGAGMAGANVWVGDGVANVWDTSTANWSLGAYADDTVVVFDDTGSASPAVDIAPVAVSPFSVTVNASSKAYEIGGAGIAGAGGLTKTGTAALVLSGANSYTGPTLVQAGSLTLSGALDGSSLTVVPGATFTQTASGLIAGEAVSLICQGNATFNGANTFGGAATFGVPGTPNLAYVVNHNNALGATAGGTLIHGGNSTTLSRLYLGSGVTVTDETLTLSGASNYRAGLAVYASNTRATWAGDIVAIGAAYIECNGGELVIGGSEANTVTNSGSTSLSIRGPGTIVLNGRINIGTGNGLLRNDSGTFLVNTTNNVWGGTGFAEGTIRLGVSDALPRTTTMNIGKSDKKALCVFDLNGYDQTVAGLYDVHYPGPDDHSGTQRILSAAPATLTIDTTQTRSFGLEGSAIEGAVTLVKLGSGSLTLTGPNSYSGATVVSNGTLAVSASGTLGAGSTNVVVGGTGTLSLSNSEAIADNATVLMPERGVATAKIQLDAGVEETVGWLLYGNAFKGVGTYGATGSGADHIDDTHFSGTGVLRVLRSKNGLIMSLR
jgi:autotransporter-associated beta strand protein